MKKAAENEINVRYGYKHDDGLCMWCNGGSYHRVFICCALSTEMKICNTCFNRLSVMVEKARLER